MSYQNLRVEKEAGYALITLDHPPANAISSAVVNELTAILDELEHDDEVRAVLMIGAGERFFSAGADVKEFGSVDPATQMEGGHALFNRIEAFPKPFVVALNGMALGGGLELAMAAHIRLAADTAQVGQPEIRLGIIPGWGGTQRLPRLIGRSRALELLLTGERISAQEAQRLGLVSRVVPRENLLAEGKALAARLAKGPPVAMRAIIDAVGRGLDVPLAEGLAIEKEAALATSKSEDAGIGVMAFLTKQEPQFKGK